MQSRVRGGLARGLVVYLGISLLPTPVVVSSFLSRPSSASATVGVDAAKSRPSLTDLAPRQPRLLRDPAEEPAARLARIGRVPDEAAAVNANLERPIREAPALFAPRRSPPVPDPFVRLPARAAYRRLP